MTNLSKPLKVTVTILLVITYPLWVLPVLLYCFGQIIYEEL